jgi:CelD/BcsL family acetyltransferase involved in cellulose biosynthesis
VTKRSPTSVSDSSRRLTGTIVHTLDPLRDPRWDELVRWHPRATVFHTVAWLTALKRTYGYEPVAFTTCAPGDRLEHALVFCHVRSWLTGDRLVSLPFSDHCDALTSNLADCEVIVRYLANQRRACRWRYIELRPPGDGHSAESEFGLCDRFWLHRLDLRPGEQILFRSFSKDSIQRKIHRAQREALRYQEGRSGDLLEAFYQLLVMTRRRHLLPPQPVEWFRNLVSAFGDAAKICVARSGDRPIAAILTLSHRDTIVYKYGASDATAHPLGGMHLLFWKTIQEGCANGQTVLDLGRSDTDNDGLATFKDRWGATRSQMTYWRYPVPGRPGRMRRWAVSGAKRVLPLVPDSCRSAAGRLLYRHAG